MRKEFTPHINKIYAYDRHCLLLIRSGSGIFEVDFKQYAFDGNKLIFLSPRQYFRWNTDREECPLFHYLAIEICSLESAAPKVVDGVKGGALQGKELSNEHAIYFHGVFERTLGCDGFHSYWLVDDI